MSIANINVYKIKQKLSKIPEDRLEEINDFIDFILMKAQTNVPNIVKFEGIWKGLGFDKITDLESEIHKIREEATRSLLL